MRRLGCIASAGFGKSALENMEIIKNAGFDSTFISWEDGTELDEYVRQSERTGLAIETLHAPFYGMNDFWSDADNKGDLFCEKLRRCIWEASRVGVKYVILHTTYTNRAPLTSNMGLVRFGKLVCEAEKKGVYLAFENLEFARHLALVLDTFKSDHVGFCYDTGHEYAYTPGIRYLPMFGERFFCTHIHDNLGLGKTKDVNYLDDLHRLPFDGSIDFEEVCRNIKKTGFTGTLMLEVMNKQPYDFYGSLSAEEFYGKAFDAAKKLRTMTDGE